MKKIKDPTDKIHYRVTEHFLSINPQEEFQQVVDTPAKRQMITDLQFQISGYSVFDKKTLLKNFFNYLFQIMETIRKEVKIKIKVFKITIGGFSFDGQDSSIRKNLYWFLNELKQKETMQFLQVLHIHTAFLEQATLEDFQELLSLSIHRSEANFKEFSLQCANWSFVENPPKVSELKKSFQSFLSYCKIDNKKFRLQLSGWYYSKEEALHFLELENPEQEKEEEKERLKEKINEKVGEFHADMKGFVQQLLNGMNEVEDFELDMRNWNDILKMENLKKQLDKVFKADRREISIIPKKVQPKYMEEDEEEEDMEERDKEQRNEEEKEKQLKIRIAM